KRAALHRVEGRLSDRPIRLRIANERKALPQWLERLTRAEGRAVADLARRLDGQAKLLESYSYQGVLMRGYAVVRDADGKPLRSGAGQAAGAHLDIEFAGDRLAATVAADGAAPPRPKPAPEKQTAKKPDSGTQGSLL